MRRASRALASWALGRWILAGCLLGQALGCSSDRLPTYPVTGRVVFTDGDPVKTGLLEFRSVEHGLNARADIARDGSFVLGTFETGDGAVAGNHQAIVIQFLATDSGPDIEHDHGASVDSKFANYTTSELEFEIKPAPNELLITVESSDVD